MERRAFLRLSGAAMAGLLAGGCVQPAASRRQRVLIVGAGMAGLAAATTLAQSGMDVLVLEARDRIGGRIWTDDTWKDAPVDLGASWIHGAQGNPITAVAREAGARTVATSYDSAITYDAGGKPLDSAGEAQLDRLSRKISQVLRAAQDGDHDQSIQSAVETGLDWDTLSPDDRNLADFILNSTIEQEYGGSIAELSAFWYDSDAAFDGDDLLFPDGYRAVTDHVARGIPIELGQRVRQVEWGAGKVVVSTDRAVYTGDRAIVTLPLGVLQAGTVEFTPGLPAGKRQAIAALGMGLLNKCYLRFPRVFWPAEYDWLETIPADKGRWVEWVSFARPAGQPILLGFNAADFGREIEAWTDEQVVASAMQTLRTIFGAGVPDPLDYRITRWASDPLALGSYSFNALGSTPEMRDELAASLGGRVFFAGEATERETFGTVHGAYLSGLRAAKEVLRETVQVR